MYRTKEFYSTSFGERGNKSARERLDAISNVELYLPDGITAAHVGTANVFKNMTDDLWRTLQNYTLPSKTLKDQLVITAVNIIPERRNLKYMYSFKTNVDVTDKLGAMYMAAMLHLGLDLRYF